MYMYVTDPTELPLELAIVPNVPPGPVNPGDPPPADLPPPRPVPPIDPDRPSPPNPK